MNKLLSLLALSAVGCGAQGGLPVVEVPLAELPETSLVVNRYHRGNDFAILAVRGEIPEVQCYSVPRKTRLSVNGSDFAMSSPGSSVPATAFRREDTCGPPSFEGGKLRDEPRTEFILSEGQTRWRAVFLGLRASRSFRVNGQEQATVRSGAELDIEWFPATDKLGGMTVELMAEGGTNRIKLEKDRIQGNHIYATFASAPAGRYVLSVSGVVSAGVEVCEGFSLCDAPTVIYGDTALSTTLTLEAP